MTDCDHDKKEAGWDVTNTQTSEQSIKMATTAGGDYMDVGPEVGQTWKDIREQTVDGSEGLCNQIENCDEAQDELLLMFQDLQTELSIQLKKEEINNGEIFKELTRVQSKFRPQANEFKQRVANADIDRQTLEEFWESAEKLESTISEWQEHVVDKWDYSGLEQQMNSANESIVEWLENRDRVGIEDLPKIEKIPEVGQMVEGEKEICSDIQDRVEINLEENHNVSPDQLRKRYKKEEQEVKSPAKSQSEAAEEAEEQKETQTQSRRR